MTTTSLRTHPIRGAASAVRAELAQVAEVEPVYMSTADKAAALEDLAAAEAQVAELRLRVMATADDVAVEHGDRDVALWLAHHARAEPRAMRADLELARELDRNYSVVAAGMREGSVSLAQARVITRAVGDLPDDLDAELPQLAEKQLVAYAAEFRPAHLRRLGRRILDVVAPEIADEEDAKILAEQERRAHEKASLRFQPLGDGTTRLTGLLPDPVADRLRTYLEAFTSPRHHDGDDGEGGFEARRQGSSHLNHREPGRSSSSPRGTSGRIETPAADADQPEWQPLPRRYAHAFGALLEHLDPTQLPHHGGDATTVMVTLSLDQLRTGLATAGLIDGDLSAGPNLTADQARRLACTSKIVPVVLGGESEILDQGRARRLFTPAQRKAMRLRDQTCRAEGCDTPATWCEAHHLDPWSEGGSTDLADGVLLCCHHHHRAHDPTYRTDQLPDGGLRFSRRS